MISHPGPHSTFSNFGACLNVVSVTSCCCLRKSPIFWISRLYFMRKEASAKNGWVRLAAQSLHAMPSTQEKVLEDISTLRILWKVSTMTPSYQFKLQKWRLRDRILRNGWSCEYPTPKWQGLDERLRLGESGRTMIGSLNQLPERSSQTLLDTSLAAVESSNHEPFPPAFFLDLDLFQQCRLTTPQDFATIPAYIQPFVGDLDSIRNVATKYFNKIQIWMPIVARKRLFRYLLNPLSRIRADITLLIVAMRVMTIFPVDTGSDPKIPLYVAVKRFYAEAESLGVLSLPCLQAGVLISIYEFGHGIYPAAFFTIASCARYAALLGLDAKQPLFQDNPSDWVQVEERRRVWWAILIVDR